MSEAAAAYVDRAGLEARFGASGVAALLDGRPEDAAARLARALRDASALVDAHLRGRYRLPLATPSPLASALAADVARFLLYDHAAPESVRARYQDALSRLRDIAQGRMTLETTQGEAQALPNGPGEGSAAVRFSARARALADGARGTY